MINVCVQLGVCQSQVLAPMPLEISQSPPRKCIPGWFSVQCNGRLASENWAEEYVVLIRSQPQFHPFLHIPHSIRKTHEICGGLIKMANIGN